MSSTECVSSVKILPIVDFELPQLELLPDKRVSHASVVVPAAYYKKPLTSWLRFIENAWTTTLVLDNIHIESHKYYALDGYANIFYVYSKKYNERLLSPCHHVAISEASTFSNENITVKFRSVVAKLLVGDDEKVCGAWSIAVKPKHMASSTSYMKYDLFTSDFVLETSCDLDTALENILTEHSEETLRTMAHKIKKYGGNLHRIMYLFLTCVGLSLGTVNRELVQLKDYADVILALI